MTREDGKPWSVKKDESFKDMFDEKEQLTHRKARANASKHIERRFVVSAAAASERPMCEQDGHWSKHSSLTSLKADSARIILHFAQCCRVSLGGKEVIAFMLTIEDEALLRRFVEDH